MKSNNETIYITIPLTDFVRSHLGNGFEHSRPISQEIAEVIFSLTSNKHTCYVQWADEWSPYLAVPVLWDFGKWIESSERWLRQKKRSDAERILRFIEEANVKITASAIQKMTDLPMDVCKARAFRLVHNKKWKAIAALGVERIVLKEEEL